MNFSISKNGVFSKIKAKLIKPSMKRFIDKEMTGDSVSLVCGVPTKKTVTGYQIVSTKKCDFGRKLVLNHCDFHFFEIRIIDGITVGISGSQAYQLNYRGIPVSHGQHTDDFVAPEKTLEIGESDYFECYAEKTFTREVASVSQYKVCKIQLGCDPKDEPPFFVIKRGATYAILNEQHNYVLYDGVSISFHDIYRDKNGTLIGSLGASKQELNEKTGIPVEYPRKSISTASIESPYLY